MVRQVGPEQSVRPQYKLQKVIANAVAVVACLEASVGAWATHYIAEDTLHKPTGQELLIAQALGEISGDKAPAVRCVSVQEMHDRATMGMDKLGIGSTAPEKAHGRVPLIPIIDRPFGLMWIQQEDCDNASAFAAHPPTTDGEMHTSQVETEIISLEFIAHEGWHVRGTIDETRTQCRAVLTVAKLAVALGLEPERAADVTAVAVGIQKDADAGTGLLLAFAPGSPYHLNRNCLSGGADDIPNSGVPPSLYPGAQDIYLAEAHHRLIP